MQADTLLLRQVNPSWNHNGRVSSQVFTPTAKDEGMLSAYNGDMIQPEKSWEHYTIALGLKSDGVVAVTVGECNAEQLPTVHDEQPYPEHCFIDFRDSSLSGSAIKKKADNLAKLARSRGWIFQAS